MTVSSLSMQMAILQYSGALLGLMEATRLKKSGGNASYERKMSGIERSVDELS